MPSATTALTPCLQQISKLMEIGGLIKEVSEKTSVDTDNGWKAISRDPSASLSTLSGERRTTVSGENAQGLCGE